MDEVSCELTIFEGVDGAGKTTAAQAYANLTGARYVHFPSLPRVGRSLARMYVEAMLPALLGYQDVVFDRSWLSELPYGVAFREGYDRLDMSSRRMLERLAMRCGAVVVHCRPEWEVVGQNYHTRKRAEMLENTRQLKLVYDLYGEQQFDLPEVRYDYATRPVIHLLSEVDNIRFDSHPLDLASAGNWNAPYVLVGESFAERKSTDAFYQWPFASFSGEGCSQWLTEQLEYAGVDESEILWINADQDLARVADLGEHFIALGDRAAEELQAVGIRPRVVPHPQYWKRFRPSRRYPLIDVFDDIRG